MPQISGRLLTSDGKPVVGVSVSLYTKLEFSSFSEVRRRIPEYTALGGGVTAAGRKDGSAVVAIRRTTRTDADGRYTLSSPRRGQLTLVAHIDGHVPMRLRLGDPVEDVSADHTFEKYDAPG